MLVLADVPDCKSSAVTNAASSLVMKLGLAQRPALYSAVTIPVSLSAIFSLNTSMVFVTVNKLELLYRFLRAQESVP